MRESIRLSILGIVVSLALIGCKDNEARFERERSIAAIQQETARISLQVAQQRAQNLGRQHAHEKDLERIRSREWNNRLKIGGALAMILAFGLGVLRYINSQQNRLQALTITALETYRDLFVADKISEEKYTALVADAWAHNRRLQLPGPRKSDEPLTIEHS